MKTSVVHGDFRLDNIIFDKQDSRLELVLVQIVSTFKEHTFFVQLHPNIDNDYTYPRSSLFFCSQNLPLNVICNYIDLLHFSENLCFFGVKVFLLLYIYICCAS
jgi:hypothetical protein